jgi:hypothetical protein
MLGLDIRLDATNVQQFLPLVPSSLAASLVLGLRFVKQPSSMMGPRILPRWIIIESENKQMVLTLTAHVRLVRQMFAMMY